MKNFLSLLLLVGLALTLPADAGMNISAGTGTHTHADANTGGNSLLPKTIIADQQDTSGNSSGLTVFNSPSGRTSISIIGDTETSGGPPWTSSPVTLIFGQGLPATCKDQGPTGLITCRRWGIRKTSATENGGDTGSDFQLESFTDTGAHKAYPFSCTRANGNCSFAFSLGSTKPCDAGYTREGPNFCAINTFSSNLLTRDLCTSVGVSSNAVAVLVYSEASAGAANSIAQRNSVVQFYTDNTCTTVLRDGASSTAYEFVATPGAPGIGRDTIETSVPTPTSTLWIKQTDDAGNQGIGLFGIVGYYD